ncbi:MAG: hypothetical protein KAS63_06600, partial [Candidatus Heimdallarchaeota archaeon]|nr:hypothetical protein [Candidatus Heimdallarchaeota archaeon]MCK4955013.1 hypothetical protein [Candidatus Heimdallarchaeota archaeon]
DPFFSGLGNPISSASVSYQTSWGDNAGMNFNVPYYENTILVSAIAENYSIDLLAEGSFLQSHSVQFSVKVLHTFAFNNIQHDVQINHTDPLQIRFELIDTSNISTIIFPDEIRIFINNTLIPSGSYSNETIGDETLITIQENELMENVSFYDINVTVSKRNFIDSFSNEQASFNFVVETLPISTRIQLVTSEIEVYHNNQTTISFRFIDTIHSEDIVGASIEVSLDITEGEIVTHYEEDGVYHCVLRIFEPSVSSLNVFLNITKHGYETKINFLLASVNIKIPELGGIRPALIAVLIVAIVASLATVSFFVIRSRLQTRRQTQITQKSKVRDIYQATYMIKRLLIVHHETSSPVFEINMDERMVIDPSIISGVLQAISSIGQEMVGARTGIRKIEYYGFVITSASSGAYTVYLFSDTELVKELDDGIQRIANWFDVIFGYEGVNWQGSMDIFKNYHDNIMERIVDELYLWVLYPVEVTSKGLEDIAELDTVSQKIISFVDKKTKVTPAVIMDQLTEYEKETLLTKLFSLVDNEYLKKNISD